MRYITKLLNSIKNKYLLMNYVNYMRTNVTILKFKSHSLNV